MKYNKDQKEGIARIQDTLAVSSIIGAVLGITGHSVLTLTEITLLMLASLILVVNSLLIRK